MTYKLVLLRHGQSEWNEKNLFTGWVDVNLTDKGRAEAQRGGELLKERHILPDVVHTSLQRRAINTANISLDAADRLWIPVKRTWRLNERHYGALQGKNKSEIREEYGDEKFMTWRRSYDVPPPPLDDNDPYSQANDPATPMLRTHPAPSASRMFWAVCSRTGNPILSLILLRVRLCWSRRTATRCARW